MKTLTALALATTAGIAFAGSTNTFTDMASFLAEVEPGFYDESFGDVAFGPADSLDFTNGTFSYTASGGPSSENGGVTVSGLFNDTGLLSLDNATDALLITFTSGNVTAVGGDFFASDFNFFEIPAEVTVTLGDGTIVSFTGGGFAGFTSDALITSISIEASDDTLGGPAWPTVDRLIVGTVVPAPGALAFLGMGSLVATRRRR